MHFPPQRSALPSLDGLCEATQNLHRHPVLFGSALGARRPQPNSSVLAAILGGRKPTLGPCGGINCFFVAATAPPNTKRCVLGAMNRPHRFIGRLATPLFRPPAGKKVIGDRRTWCFGWAAEIYQRHL